MHPNSTSPLVGEAGGGPAASAAEQILCSPPPNPPHEGEGLKRLSLPPQAIERARSLRRRMTEAERAVWQMLREALPAHHWRKQVPLGRFIVDFASHSSKVVIEIDGGQHAADREYDDRRAAFLIAEGYRVLRFWNNDVLNNISGVHQRIAEELATQ